MSSQGYIYSGSNTESEVACRKETSEIVTSKVTKAVGTKIANELEIYDMSGSVSVWCQSRWTLHRGATPSLQHRHAAHFEKPNNRKLRTHRGSSKIHQLAIVPAFFLAEYPHHHRTRWTLENSLQRPRQRRLLPPPSSVR